jgi:copper(I)-binding protein
MHSKRGKTKTFSEKLVFKPGSWHIMMINPEKVPKEGSSVAITLLFDNGLS